MFNFKLYNINAQTTATTTPNRIVCEVMTVSIFWSTRAFPRFRPETMEMGVWQWWASRTKRTERGEPNFGFLRSQSKSVCLLDDGGGNCTSLAFQTNVSVHNAGMPETIEVRYERVPANLLSSSPFDQFNSVLSLNRARSIRKPFSCSSSSFFYCVLNETNSLLSFDDNGRQCEHNSRQKGWERTIIVIAFLSRSSLCARAALSFFVIHFETRKKQNKNNISFVATEIAERNFSCVGYGQTWGSASAHSARADIMKSCGEVNCEKFFGQFAMTAEIISECFPLSVVFVRCVPSHAATMSTRGTSPPPSTSSPSIYKINAFNSIWKLHEHWARLARVRKQRTIDRHARMVRCAGTRTTTL